jgi:hypothetical protein
MNNEKRGKEGRPFQKDQLDWTERGLLEHKRDEYARNQILIPCSYCCPLAQHTQASRN